MTTTKFLQATLRMTSVKTGLRSIGRCQHFSMPKPFAQVARMSTAARVASDDDDDDRPAILGLDSNHVEDVMTSIKAIELVLHNLHSTQERQRQLFHEESDTLIPSRNSRMNILFQEAGLQQSIIRKCLNNIRENLMDAEKPLVSRFEEEHSKQT